MPIITAGDIRQHYDVCIVGSGPSGLACAFRAWERGLSVIVLEAGGRRPVPGDPDVLAAEIPPPSCQDPVEITAASALGGTSHWWGGRSVPFDPVDFRFWPISEADLVPWWEEGAKFLGSRSIYETPPQGPFARLQRFDTSRSECWGPQLNMARRWRSRIIAVDGPHILLDTRVTGLAIGQGRVEGVDARLGGETRRMASRHVVLACGGLGSIRLLLLAQRETPHLFGGAGGPLGRGYMGHLTGSLAEFVPASMEPTKSFACVKFDDGAFARRRMRPTTNTVLSENLQNIAFWIENASVDDPGEGSAVASARYLAARAVRMLKRRRIDHGALPLLPHIATVARSPLVAANGLWQAAYLLASSRVRGRHPRSTILNPNGRGALPLWYHAEQPAYEDNRISLGDTVDSVGLPRIKIQFIMKDQEIDSVVRAHDLLDQDLRQAQAGYLKMGNPDEIRAKVRATARDGYHQMGGTVMSQDPQNGVVDTQSRAFGFENLWVGSSSVFPSGSQANPTLTIVVLSIRIADTIAADSKQTHVAPRIEMVG